VDYNVADVVEATKDELEVLTILPSIVAGDLARTVWQWLQEFPLANFDDFGPKSVADLVIDVQRRIARGERVWVAWRNCAPIGIIGYAPVNSYCGMFHGICFAEEWHNTGVAQAAVGKVIDEIFATSQQKISASFFRDNERVHSFLHGLGFTFEGLMTRQTLRGGKPVDMLLLALFKEDWLCRSADS